MPGQKFEVWPVDHLWYERRVEHDRRYEQIQPNIYTNSSAGYEPKIFDPTPKSHRIAIVGYGASLRDTWSELKTYSQIWTCSGAHDFLLERGIVPTHHTDIDYREYKAAFIKQPHPDVEYVMATACHPKYLEKLQQYKLRVFHAKSPKHYDYPDGYPLVDYGWDCGQQAIMNAYLDGWIHQDWYGFDYSTPFNGTMKTDAKSTESHAGPHHGQRSALIYLIANNILFESTQTHLSASLALLDWLNKYPDADIQIHSNEFLLNMLESRAAHERTWTLNHKEHGK